MLIPSPTLSRAAYMDLLRELAKVEDTMAERMLTICLRLPHLQYIATATPVRSNGIGSMEIWRQTGVVLDSQPGPLDLHWNKSFLSEGNYPFVKSTIQAVVCGLMRAG